MANFNTPGLSKRVRSTFAIQRGVIFAIAIREMFRKFGDYKLGTLWALLEPLMMMLLFMGIFGARGRGEFGYIEPPLFILSAFLPFRGLFDASKKEVMTATNVSNSLSHLRQVSLFDIMLAKVFMNSAIQMLVLIIISFGLLWLGYNPIPHRLLETLFGLLLIVLFGFGLGLVFVMLETYAKEINKFTKMINMPLLFLSAVFFPMSTVPEPFRTYLSYNPLVHNMEYIREMWFDHYESPVVDLVYMAWWLVGLWGLGLALYRVRWRYAVKQS